MTSGTVLVTGAASGIGLSLAQRLRASGFTVLGWDVNPDVDCVPASVDVSDWDSVRLHAVDLPQRLDAVVSCAGVGLRGNLTDNPMEDFDRTMRVNVTGTANVAAATKERLSPGGIFIAVGSVAGQIPMAGRAAYCSSKAAVAMLAKCLASEWADDGIQAVCVSPGFMDAGMAASSSASGGTSLQAVLGRTPTSRLVPVDGLLDVFAVLVSGQMRAVTGTEITVDEGFTAGWKPN